MTSVIEKICGICSNPIVAGYLTFGNYCGTTVCMNCLSKNTWSMCRKCNGTLIHYRDTTTTIPPNISVSETEELLTASITKLKSELERVQAINRFANSIARSSEIQCQELTKQIDNIEKQFPEVIMELTRKEQRQTNPGTYISLIPNVTDKVSVSADIPEQPLTDPEYNITCKINKYLKFELILRVRDRQLRLIIHKMRYANKNISSEHSLSKEYAEIVARSGQPCDIGFLDSPKDGTKYAAIKTLDGNVHILYCGNITLPHEPSRYVDYVRSPLPLRDLRLVVSDSFIDEKKFWHFSSN